MRLIDADALKEEFDNLLLWKSKDIELIKEVIDNVPAIIKCGKTSDGLPLMDLRPRPQGEWIIIHNALGETKYKCDQCKHYIKPSDDKNFCGNCGADMRGEKE